MGLSGRTLGRLRMHHRAISVWMLVLLLAACGVVSRDEVAVVASPDRPLEAVLIETNGGATTSFGYEIWVREKGHGSDVPNSAAA